MLVVSQPFGTHRRGDAITDAADIASVLASENAHRVVNVSSALVVAAPTKAEAALADAEAALKTAEAAIEAAHPAT